MKQSHLLHERLVVPEEPFLHHDPVLPLSDRGHGQTKGLARWLNSPAFANWHGLREGPHHYAHYCSPFAFGYLYGVLKYGLMMEHQIQH